MLQQIGFLCRLTDLNTVSLNNSLFMDLNEVVTFGCRASSNTCTLHACTIWAFMQFSFFFRQCISTFILASNENTRSLVSFVIATLIASLRCKFCDSSQSTMFGLQHLPFLSTALHIHPITYTYNPMDGQIGGRVNSKLEHCRAMITDSPCSSWTALVEGLRH